jgi:peptidoglycan L-alanyl-D-glutamate endopeptidase CwlK
VITRAERLDGVHPDLVKIVIRAGVHCDFQVQCGLRTPAEQRALVAKGASQTLNSRHLTGHAVDITVLVNRGKDITWEFTEYERVAKHFLVAAHEFNIPIIWGGSWKMRDGPHFELARSHYPEELST